MSQRQNAQKADGDKSTRIISGRGETDVEPIEHRQRSKRAREGQEHFASGLYLVATPIGNLRDITLRALDLLAAADLVACEDTRVTGRLMAHFGLNARRLPYHEHNAEQARPRLIGELKAGALVALVSDAGTPLVSDPGYKLVRDALAVGIPVTALPGPAAPLMALQLSGLSCDRFLFAGFLPPKSMARKRVLAEFAALRATLIFFETAPRLAVSLADMAEIFGDRPAAVARELTKLYEEVRRARLGELAEHYQEARAPKGELVVAVGPPEAETRPAEDILDAELGAALATMSVKDASAAVAAATGRSRRLVYQRALALAGRTP